MPERRRFLRMMCIAPRGKESRTELMKHGWGTDHCHQAAALRGIGVGPPTTAIFRRLSATAKAHEGKRPNEKRPAAAASEQT